MSGYTPVFQSIFTGTLCGRYPDTAAWMFFLALADKHGVVDMTPEYISSVTGMPVDDLLACIRSKEAAVMVECGSVNRKTAPWEKPNEAVCEASSSVQYGETMFSQFDRSFKVCAPEMRRSIQVEQRLP